MKTSKNAAEVTKSGSTYTVKVNGGDIISDTDENRMNIIAERLNVLFCDKDRDLDFITPSYANGEYVVCCPLVRMNQGLKTYLYDSNPVTAPNNYYPEKLYEDTNWNNSGVAATQSAILTATESSRPWYWALYYANKIRAAIQLNFADAKGNATCQQLHMPSNTGTTVNSVISNSSNSSGEYGHKCQGSAQGTYSSCSCGTGFYNKPENILNPWTRCGEIFHPQDLTVAMQSGNNWYDDYVHHFLKITTIATPTKSIVVRVTDKGNSASGIELNDRVYRILGLQGTGNNLYKIEHMGY